MPYITLNKNNFFNNLDIIKKQTKDINKIALVLKDNAYGHGLLEVASMAKEYGITKAVVSTCSEANQILNYFNYILILGEIPAKSAVSDKLRYTINDINSITKFPKGTLVELKVDTGMHRNGINPTTLNVAIKMIEENGLILEAIFTHHRSADKLTSEWFWQNENFKKIKSTFPNLRFHSANSDSLFRYENFDEDITRVGIAAYGCLDVDGLKPILSLYANKLSTRVLHVGEAIGYGATYTAKKEETVSNYDFGYGDGFLRNLSNNYTTPNNEKLIGTISMDNSSFLSDKDELLIFNDARKIAVSANTISYEILTALKSNIKRKIIVFSNGEF